MICGDSRNERDIYITYYEENKGNKLDFWLFFEIRKRLRICSDIPAKSETFTNLTYSQAICRPRYFGNPYARAYSVANVAILFSVPRARALTNTNLEKQFNEKTRDFFIFLSCSGP